MVVMLAKRYLLDAQIGFVFSLRGGSHLHVEAHLTGITGVERKKLLKYYLIDK